MVYYTIKNDLQETTVCTFKNPLKYIIDNKILRTFEQHGIGGRIMDNNCIFCRIIGNEISSVILYEDDDFRVIMDISPAAKGHAILITKKHFANIFELDEETASKAFVVAAKVAKAMREELHCEGLNILQNSGEAAGQTVFHFHIHLIPRFANDSVTITWQRGNYEAGEIEVIANAIHNSIH